MTGATGMVGTLLTEHFTRLGWRVHALQRRDTVPANNLVTSFRYVLTEPVDPRSIEGVDAVIHCAVATYDRKRRDADEVNRTGTQQLLDACHERGVRVVFLSSMAAHEAALSHYGRTKRDIEGECGEHDLILRPGLVLAHGGLFSRIVQIIRKCAMVPLIGGGSQPLQPVQGGDLCRCVELCVRNGVTGALTIGSPEPSTIKGLYEAIAGELGLRRRFPAVPLWSALGMIRFAEALSIPIGVSRESALGLKRMVTWDTGRDLERLGVTLMPMQQAVASLL